MGQLPSEPRTQLNLDYPVFLKQRAPSFPIHSILNKRRACFESTLVSFLEFKSRLERIPVTAEWDDLCPRWVNGFIPGLDAIALYAFVAQKNPKYYVEVGSGNSTKFVRRAIQDNGLTTKIISLDPHPRAEIDSICDQVIRKPFEDIDFGLELPFLGSDDIFFFDGSHRCFQNSDATVFFTEVLWKLPKNMLIGVHDIFFPFDYPEAWVERCYSEQYLLAACLLADQGVRINTILPAAFVSSEHMSQSILDPIWRTLSPETEPHGCAFWFSLTS